MSRIHCILETSQHLDGEEWIRSNAKIGPVLENKRPNTFMGSHREWYQQIRYRNVRRITHCENVELFISTGKPVAKGKPKPKSVVNSSINMPIRERKWIDIDTPPFDHIFF